MFTGSVIEHQINDDLNITLVRLFKKAFEIVHRPIFRIDRVVIGHIIAMIGGGGIDRHKPDALDPQALQIIQLFSDAVEIADAIPVTVAEGANKNLIEDGVIPPRETFGALDDCCWCKCGGWSRSRCRWRAPGHQQEEKNDREKLVEWFHKSL